MSLENLPIGSSEGLGGIIIFMIWRIYKMVNDSHLSLRNIEIILDERLTKSK